MLKTIHILTVYTSLSLFFVRFLWMTMDSPKLQQKWVKIVPHVNDSVLLISAIMLAMQISQYPFVHSWLTVKVIALLIYIVLGTIALKRGKTKNFRIGAGVLAIITFAFMLSVAVTKSPTGFIPLG